jgi:hypothetical protein
MKKYPESVLTKSKSGKIEVRALDSKGKYVLYHYLDSNSGKSSSKKQKLILKSREGKILQWFLIPLQQGKNLMIPAELKEPEKKIWNEKKKKEENLF